MTEEVAKKIKPVGQKNINKYLNNRGKKPRKVTKRKREPYKKKQTPGGLVDNAQKIETESQPVKIQKTKIVKPTSEVSEFKPKPSETAIKPKKVGPSVAELKTSQVSLEEQMVDNSKIPEPIQGDVIDSGHSFDQQMAFKHVMDKLMTLGESVQEMKHRMSGVSAPTETVSAPKEESLFKRRNPSSVQSHPFLKSARLKYNF